MDRLEGIANLAQLAAVLEVSTEKPGNVTPTHNFPDTTYVDFLSGSVALGLAIRKSALRGFKAGEGGIRLDEIGVGAGIEEAVLDVGRSHSGVNTHLGMLMLFIPIASGAGFCVSRGLGFEQGLRGSIKTILENTSVDDSLSFYRAVKASNVGGMLGGLREPKIPFHDLMRMSSSIDRISEELAEGMRIIFEIGVPTLDRMHRETRDIREAVLQTYLILLSEFPDTFIARKVGQERASHISGEAMQALVKGGIFTKAGRSAIKELDSKLRVDGSKLNPGTTADLTAAALFIWLLYERLQNF